MRPNNKDALRLSTIVKYALGSVILLWVGYLSMRIIWSTSHHEVQSGGMDRQYIRVAGNPVPNDPQIVPNPYEVHVVFSTDCGGFQDWQSLLLFHSATQVGQRGPITRIASGCEEDKKKQLTELYQKLYPNYHVHFTPDFSIDPKTGKKYYFYNKPYGVLHWLDYAQPAIAPGTVVALIDPDFIFLRPLTAKMSGQANTIVTSGTKMLDVFDVIEKGKPVAQQYGLGAPWINDNHKKFNRTYICGEHSPCRGVNNPNEAEKHYAVGAPYVMDRDDLQRLTRSWVDFVPRVFEHYPHLLAEMYAYSMAAAHEELPHLRVDHFMVSNTEAGGEGWQWVDALPDVCVPPVNGVYFPDKPLPTFLHYCQGYDAEVFHFYKRNLPNDLFSCDRPMMKEISLSNMTSAIQRIDECCVNGL